MNDKTNKTKFKLEDCISMSAQNYINNHLPQANTDYDLKGVYMSRDCTSFYVAVDNFLDEVPKNTLKVVEFKYISRQSILNQHTNYDLSGIAIVPKVIEESKSAFNIRSSDF